MNSKMWKGKSANLISANFGPCFVQFGGRNRERNRGILCKCSDRHVKVFLSSSSPQFFFAG